VSIFAASELGAPFEVPPVGELFNFRPLLELGGIFDINRVVLITLTATALSMLLFYVAFSKPKLVPGRLQAAVEAIVQFIRELAIDIIGPEGRRFVPFLMSIFMFVLLNNLFGIIPGVSLPATSKIALPMFLAVIVWFTFIIVGMRQQGPIRYFRDILIPPGAPKAILPLLAPIEFVSNIILRPITLTIRLFANMVAGHILLTVVFLAMNAFLFSLRGLPVGIAVTLISPVAVGFELFIEFLQAYIFVILTAVYIAGSVHAEH
jgi:F-type H+-transporting ATPase subunit a